MKNCLIRWIAGFLIFSLAMISQSQAQAASNYIAGSIKPNHVEQSDLDRQLVVFYQQWKKLYVVQACGDGRFFIKVNADGKRVGGDTAPGTITVSEAHGYGMMLMVLMAERDPQAHAIFDGMVRYFKDFPATSNPGLMAWNQVTGCKNAGGRFRGQISATDGDLDIAYALLLADSTWGSKGSFNYRKEADRTLDAILSHDVHGQGGHLMIGDWPIADGEPEIAMTTRSSDFMQSHLKAFADATGDKRWLEIRDRTYDIIDDVRKRYASKTGLMPDFIFHLDTKPTPATAGFLGDERDGLYSWNAARYPWRVAMDYLLYAEPRARTALQPLNQWARMATKDNPRHLADSYRLDGRTLPDHSKNSMAFVSAFGISAMIDAGNQMWLNAIWDDMVERKISDEDYYGNTLKLLSMVVLSGNWKKP
ncbi:glycosyl hydrolase family 8 [Phyllobacterium sp. OV277]|jgi:endo-1,4-beta-D-glucanase Y|uniref:glycosyl hydrolase family 8 n=1 Tax=Phyllobacterium sp. OV277 TaxID=1882772 RepID=UPI000890182A|nr:glycosyl hydrolase family 8 [Phyllobacterium sp. OV277]SDO56509.1 Glycosyl hydrolases family 8 [Phyllobacterium sp. OV277]